MNYNELKRRVRNAAPCPFVKRPAYQQLSPCPYETLLFLMDDDDKTASAMFNGGHVRVSGTQICELMELAQWPRKGECCVSEIKVGDKVRVVQITMKENKRNRARYLGKEGVVGHVWLASSYPYGVILSGDARQSYFHKWELKVLSAPCEQQEPDDTIGSLRMQITQLLAENERVHKECRRLSNQNGALHKNVTNFLEQNARLIKEKELLGAENDRLATRLLDPLIINVRLEKRIRELRKEHDDTLRVNDNIRKKLIIIANEALHVPQE